MLDLKTPFFAAPNFPLGNRELARAAVDHQTSAALAKRTPNAVSSAPPIPARTGQNLRSMKSVDWDIGDKNRWVVAGSLGEAGGANPRSGLDPRESSTEASSEEMQSSSDMRASGESVDSSGGEGTEGPLRIWAPGSRSMSFSGGMSFSMSRESSSSDPAAAVGGSGRLLSPSRSAESDTDVISPVGFWQEKFETIDARNAGRSFYGWEDNGSGEEMSPEGGRGVSLDDSSNHAGGSSVENPVPLQNLPRGKSTSSVGISVDVGRKLFVTSSSQTLSPDLEAMAEGDHEFPSPRGPPGSSMHPFWATEIEPAWDKFDESGKVVGRTSGSGRDDTEDGRGNKETEGLEWRHGAAGLVVPEPLQPKSRSVTIQQVVQKRGGRRESSAAVSEVKHPLASSQQAVASSTLTSAVESESKAQSAHKALSSGVQIVRSYSYHGLSSMALYDSANRG